MIVWTHAVLGVNMFVWTHAVLGVLYACVLHFCICTCSAQMSMFHMERISKNMLIIIIITIITLPDSWSEGSVSTLVGLVSVFHDLVR